MMTEKVVPMTSKNLGESKMDKFAGAKQSQLKAEKGLNVFFSPLFNSKNADDVNFVNKLKSGYNTGAKYDALFATMTWGKLMSELISFKRFQDAIAEEVGSHKFFFIKDFQLGDDTFKANHEIDKNYADKLILEFNRMICTQGDMDANKFMTRLPVKNQFDKTMKIYDMVKSQGKPVPGIVDDFVENYIGWKKGTAQFKLAKSNIVRMIKQAYMLTKQSDEVESPEDFRVVSQLYIMPGEQGSGKTTFLTDLFFGHISANNKFTSNPQYGQLRSQNPVYFFDEMTSVNTKAGVGELKAEVSSPFQFVNVKYDKFPVQFLKRSVIVGATNEKQLLTDTTSHGENRRYLFIPFSTKANAEKNTERVVNYWESKELPNRQSSDDYDTQSFFIDFQFSILFGNEYKDIPIEIRNEQNSNGEKEILKLNTAFGGHMKHTTGVQQSVKEFIDSFMPVVGKYYAMNAGAHKFAVNKLDEVTELKEQGLDDDDIISQVNGSKSYNDYDFNDSIEATDIIEVAKLKRINKSDIICYLNLQKVFLKSESELYDAFEMYGYSLGTYQRRACFIKNA